jgi:hypothetical protein
MWILPLVGLSVPIGRETHYFLKQSQAYKRERIFSFSLVRADKRERGMRGKRGGGAEESRWFQWRGERGGEGYCELGGPYGLWGGSLMGCSGLGDGCNGGEAVPY